MSYTLDFTLFLQLDVSSDPCLHKEVIVHKGFSRVVLQRSSIQFCLNLPRKYHTKLVRYIGVRHAVTLAESSIQFQLNRAYAITNWWFLLEFTLCFTTWRFISACLHREVIVHSGLLPVIILRSHRARHRPSNQDYQQQQQNTIVAVITATFVWRHLPPL